jgi:hypothetical protein
VTTSPTLAKFEALKAKALAEANTVKALAIALASSDDATVGKEPKRSDNDVREHCTFVLNEFVSLFNFMLDSMHGGPTARRDEVLKARRLVAKLVKRRGWLARPDEEVLEVLRNALAILSEEYDKRCDRLLRARGATPLDVIIHHLPRAQGGTPPWMEQFAVMVMDGVGAWEGKVDVASLLARIEAVAVGRDASLIDRGQLPEDSIYKAGDRIRRGKATDRWRQVVKRVRKAQAAALKQASPPMGGSVPREPRAGVRLVRER